MRLFIGIEIPDEIKEHIFNFIRPLQISPKGWEKPHDYHQTLLFLGDTSEEALVEIIKRLNQILFHPFELELNAFNFFSRRILFLGFAESVELLELKSLVDLAFPEWLRPFEKVFVPHVTIKRWQRYEFDFLESGIKSRIFPPQKFYVTGIALFKSEKNSLNHKYHVIHKVRF